MAKDINKLKRERHEKVKEMRTLVDTAETRTDKKLTAEEETRYKALEEEVENRTKEIEREERLQNLENGTAKEPGQREKPEPDGKKDLNREFGEFLLEVRNNPNSVHEERDLTMGNGSQMGMLVPAQVDTTIRMVQPQSAIFRPRALVIPAGDQPDAAFEMMALDQSGSKGVYGGVVVKWRDEKGDVQNSGDPKLTGVKIQPQEVSGYFDISDKLLRNAPAAGALATQLLQLAFIGAEEDKFMTGSGAGTPYGFLSHDATIVVTRAAANKVGYADIVSMFSRAKFGGSLVWIANQTVLPQLMTMEDSEGHLIWQPNAREGEPNTLMGLPLLFNDQSPTLGNKGDLSLVDLKYYYIKDGAPLSIFMDPFTQKGKGMTRVYAFWNVDGQPMLKTPMTLRDGKSTVSPFVVLK